MGELIAKQCRLKQEENKEANLIEKNAISEAQDANKIRDLYRLVCEIPENKRDGAQKEAIN